MKELIIYHGSNQKVLHPQYNYLKAKDTSDYGRAFYTTLDKESGKEWACKNSENGVLNIYEIDQSNLNILDLTDTSKYSVLHWICLLLINRPLSKTFKETYKDEISFILKYRLDLSDVDVIIGYRADDAYFKFPRLFVQGQISYDMLEKIYLNGSLGKQYVVYSKKAFGRIKFLDYELVTKEYYFKYQKRVEDADELFDSICAAEKQRNGKSIKNLMLGYNK